MKVVIENSTVNIGQESKYHEVWQLFDKQRFITRDVICEHCNKFHVDECLSDPSPSMYHHICIDCKIGCLEDIL